MIETNYDKVLNFIKSNYLLVIIFGIGYILGQINNIIGFIKNIIEIAKLKNKLLNKNKPFVDFNEENFDKETNVRFGFSFLYPKTWDRKNPPTNSDGNTYIHPKDQDIKMYAWGNYIIEEVADLISVNPEYCKRKKARILLNVESGKNFDIWSKKNDVITMYREQLMGGRIVYQFKRDKKKITAIESITSLEETEYHILCEAPSNIFSKYEDLFIFLHSNLKILQKD